jgi:hypothetical protein
VTCHKMATNLFWDTLNDGQASSGVANIEECLCAIDAAAKAEERRACTEIAIRACAALVRHAATMTTAFRVRM